MAQIAVTRIHDGPRNAVVHISIVGDGGGDLEDVVVVDPAAFVPPMDQAPTLSVVKMWYDVYGFTTFLEYDYLTSDTPIWTMSPGQGSCVDLSLFGGLADRSNQLDGEGKIKLSTTGLIAGDRGTIVLMVRKS
jgi:hypothetical protein